MDIDPTVQNLLRNVSVTVMMSYSLPAATTQVIISVYWQHFYYPIYGFA